MDKQKQTEPVDNYSKQVKIVGIAAIVLAVVGVIAGIYFYSQSAPKRRPTPSGGGEFIQLKGRLDRAFGLMETIGIQETDTAIVVVLYEGDPKLDWSEREREEMDGLVFMVLEEAALRDKTVFITITQPNTVVAITGQEVDVLFSVATFVCADKERMQALDWGKADHDDLLENCVLFPTNNYWGSAENILWPPAQ